MQEIPTLDDIGEYEASIREAVSAFVSASDAALASTSALDAAWRAHLRSDGPEPAAAWISEVAAQQVASASALTRAKESMRRAVLHGTTGADGVSGFGQVTGIKVKRGRRRQNKFLAGIGPGGLRLLRACILLLLLISVFIAAAAGISLSLEVAGFLHLIEDPVRLPVGTQLAVFILCGGSAFAMRRMLRPVERALYGTKAVRPKPFQF